MAAAAVAPASLLSFDSTLCAALEEAGRNLQQLGVFKRVDMLLNELPEVCFCPLSSLL